MAPLTEARVPRADEAVVELAEQAVQEPVEEALEQTVTEPSSEPLRDLEEETAVPFAVDDAPRPLPPATLERGDDDRALDEATSQMPAPPPAEASVRACEPPAHPEALPTRADDLLARFGASCVDDDRMRETAACLRRLAGLDATPAPAQGSISPPSSAPSVPTPPLLAFHDNATAEREDASPAPARRARVAHGERSRGLVSSLPFTLLVLLLGALGGGAIVRLRPDLLGVLPALRTAPAAAAPATADRPAPAAASAQPADAVVAPSFVDRLGGTRAERASGQRAR
jgi:hypothetical protein